MQKVTIAKRLRKVPSPKVNGKVNGGSLPHDGYRHAAHVDATKLTPVDVPVSEPSLLWIPLNGGERDALSTPIPLIRYRREMGLISLRRPQPLKPQRLPHE